MWDAVNKVSIIETDVLRAVRLFLHERDYVNLYRVFDLIQSHVGTAMKTWVSKAEMDRFTQTVNSPDVIRDEWARHGHRRFSTPKQPMDRETADTLVRNVLIKWIETRNAALSR